MREIKFRAWDGVEMRTDLYGGDDLNQFFKKATIPVMQFTGLVDTNGADIYEGDIVSSDYYYPEIKAIAAVKFEVVDNFGRFGFDSGEQDAFTYGYLTVIGNIHQNPELL